MVCDALVRRDNYLLFINYLLYLVPSLVGYIHGVYVVVVVRGQRDSTAFADVQSEVEFCAPELLPLWLRYGKQISQELVANLKSGGVRDLYVGNS